jgi:transcriptional regulator with XRE-family HTH domain
MSKATLGENLRAARIDVGLTQRGLARASGHAHTTVARLEQDRQDPYIRTIADIAWALHVDLDDLVRRSR